MEEQKELGAQAGSNRWLIAAAGVLMQLILGTVYSWSVFRFPFLGQHGNYLVDAQGVLQAREGGWDPWAVSFTFTLVMACTSLAAAFGGKFVDKAGARKVATIGAILFSLGTFLTGLADQTGCSLFLWVGYGLVAGIGNGLSYITPIAVLVRWFPDKRGLITGLAVMGFGFGSAVLGQITPFMLAKYEKVAALPKEYNVSESKGREVRSLVLANLDRRIEGEEKKEADKKDAQWLAKLKSFRKEAESKPMTLDGKDVLVCTKEGMSLAYTFYILGAVFLVLLVAAAQFLNNPPADWKPPVVVQAKAAAAQSETKDLSGALSMPQFYILWLVLCVNVTAGLAIISNVANMVQNACAVTPLVAGTVIFVTSLFNGLGRIFWASLSDKLGRKGTFMLILGLQIPLFIILPYMSNVIIFSVVACVIYACYGGGFATMPAYTADTFTAKNMGQIYGKILLAWGLAGIVGPMLMQHIKDRYDDFKIAMFIASGLLLLAFIVNLLYKKPPPVATPAPAKV